MRELIMIIVGQTVLIAWPYAAYAVLMRFDIPTWIVSGICMALFVLAMIVFLFLQRIRKTAEDAEYIAGQAKKWENLYVELAKEYEAFKNKENGSDG